MDILQTTEVWKKEGVGEGYSMDKGTDSRMDLSLTVRCLLPIPVFESRLGHLRNLSVTWGYMVVCWVLRFPPARMIKWSQFFRIMAEKVTTNNISNSTPG